MSLTLFGIILDNEERLHSPVSANRFGEIGSKRLLLRSLSERVHTHERIRGP